MSLSMVTSLRASLRPAFSDEYSAVTFAKVSHRPAVSSFAALSLAVMSARALLQESWPAWD